MVLSTHFSQPKLQLAACASDINSTTNCASSHQKASAQSQSARNAALSGGGRQKGGGDPMAGLMTVSQGPASAGGSIPASPTTGNTNMVGTTQTSVGAQSQTQYDSQVNTKGKIPSSSSPRANKNPPPHVPPSAANAPQQGGGLLKEEEEEIGTWVSRLNRSVGGGGGKSRGGPKTKKGKRKVRKKRKGAQTRKKKSKRPNPKKQKKGRGAKIRRATKAATQIQTAVRRHTRKKKAVRQMHAAVAQRRTQKRRRARRAKIKAVGHFAKSLRESRLRAAATWNTRCKSNHWLDINLSTVQTAIAGINSALHDRRGEVALTHRLTALG